MLHGHVAVLEDQLAAAKKQLEADAVDAFITGVV